MASLKLCKKPVISFYSLVLLPCPIQMRLQLVPETASLRTMFKQRVGTLRLLEEA